MKFFELFENYHNQNQKNKKHLLSFDFKLQQTFPSGDATLRPEIQKEIKEQLAESLNLLKKNKETILRIFIEASESKVSQDRFGGPGALSKKRAEVIQNFVKQWIDSQTGGRQTADVRAKTLTGGPEWNSSKDDKNDPKYTQHQFIRLRGYVDIVEYSPLINRIRELPTIRDVASRPGKKTQAGKNPFDVLADEIIRVGKIDPKLRPTLVQHIRTNFGYDGGGKTAPGGNLATILKATRSNPTDKFKDDAQLMPPEVHKAYMKATGMPEWMYDQLASR